MDSILQTLILPGEMVRYSGEFWKVDAVGFTGGERYYWLGQHGAQLMVPASMVEPAVRCAVSERTHAPKP